LGGDLATLAWMINRLALCGATAWKKSKPFYRRQTWRHLVQVGSDSIPIVSVISACIGIILSLQSAQQLERVGAISYVAGLVGATIVYELGPLMTAIILAGRSGAAFTAEIGTMKITEEIDALQVIGIDPVRFLVWPKFFAMVVMAPCLTLWADFVGIFSGGIFSSLFLGLNPRDYFEQCTSLLETQDLLAGLVKSLGFGIAIALIGCWQGFLAEEGASDVGRRTTKSVVLGIFSIILLDLFFTALNFIFR